MNNEIDCLVIGHNQISFSEYIIGLRQMGEHTGAFRDANLSFYEDENNIVSCRDYFNNLYHQNDIEPELNYDNIFSATIAYLCTFLDRHGITFDYINSYQEGKNSLIHILKEKKVRTVAITTTYYVVPIPIIDIVRSVRTHSPETKIIVGGPYIQTQYKIHDQESFQFILNQIGAEFYIVNSQGEQALVNIINALKFEYSFKNISNIIYHDDIRYQANLIGDESNDLSDNTVNWSLFSHDLGYNGRKMVMVRTSISCPFTCAFCSFPSHAGVYRYIDPHDICRELDIIDSIGDVRSVTFIDDTFNIPNGRFRNILEIFRQKKYRFRWNCNFRSQHANEETIALMKECGCEGVFLGIESGSDLILTNMNKKSRVEHYLKAISWLKKYGIMTYASFIIGFPGETEDTIRETIEFIESAQPDFFRAQLWYYDTMTPIHDKATLYGLTNSQFEWTHSSMNSKEAADWIDYLHSTIKCSVWLPQNDFDYPSLFNLLSRGWSVEEIKHMLRSFNSKVQKKHSFRTVDFCQVKEKKLFSSADFNF